MAGLTTAVVGTGLVVKASRDQRKAADKALDEQRQQNSENRDFIERQILKTRGEIFPLFRRAQQLRTAGQTGAQASIGEALPRQIGAFTAGNIAAQRALLSGIPQIRGAILGTGQASATQSPVNLLSGLPLFTQQARSQVDPIVRQPQPALGPLPLGGLRQQFNSLPTTEAGATQSHPVILGPSRLSARERARIVGSPLRRR